jgi:hypothetical protein
MGDINTALDGMSFNPTLNYNGAATVKIVTNDQGKTGSGGAKQATNTVAVTVNAVDDAPVNSAPGTQTVAANQTLVFNNTNGNRISITDVDAGTNQLEVTLTATNGTLSLSRITGLTFSAGDGKTDVSMTFRGTLSSINAALNGLKFNPSIMNGPASFTLLTNDLGNSGLGGRLTDYDTVNINVV